MELQRHGYTGYFLPDRLAVGEAPDTVRGVFMQRSRCAAAPRKETWTWRPSGSSPVCFT